MAPMTTCTSSFGRISHDSIAAPSHVWVTRWRSLRTRCRRRFAARWSLPRTAWTASIGK
jgi:hypothetical protein